MRLLKLEAQLAKEAKEEPKEAKGKAKEIPAQHCKLRVRLF
jgi:hypothetical protein